MNALAEGLRDARHAARDRHLVRGASAIGRDRLTTEERLSDIVEILVDGTPIAIVWDEPMLTANRALGPRPADGRHPCHE